MGIGAPQIFSPTGIPTPTSVPNFRFLRQGVGEGEPFENLPTCDLALEGPNRCIVPGKLVSDIDVVLAPYCPQMVRNPSAGVYFSAPKLDPSLLAVSADFAISSSAPHWVGIP